MANQNINVSQGYLEMARFWGMYLSPDTEVTATTMYALLAHAYVFSYMAINSYTTSLINDLWNDQQSGFRNKFPDSNSVAELVGRGGELSDLQTALKILAAELPITPIHQANGRLWNDFNQVVKEARDYFIHPKPRPDFQAHIEKITRTPKKRIPDWWVFPVRVAEAIITYIQTERGMIVPDWVVTNQEIIPVWGIKPSEEVE